MNSTPAPPTEATYVALCARQMREELVPLLAATLVALAVASPWLVAVALGAADVAPLLCAVCAAPAWAGLVDVAARTASGEAVPALAAFSAARRLFGRAAPLGAATGGFAWAFERALAAAGEHGAAEILLASASGAALLLLLAACLHAFPLLVLGDLGVRGAVRNGLGLAAASPAATLGLLAAGALTLVALRWLGPGTLLVSAPALAILAIQNTRCQLARLAS